MNRSQIYKSACLSKRTPTVFLRALRIANRRNRQMVSDINFVMENSVLSGVCSYSGSVLNEDTFDFVASYWTPFLWRPVHKNFKREYRNNESVECQTVDANCNDCKHFTRRNELAKGLYGGTCAKLNKDVKASVNTFAGNECFEHRRI